ncbi:hypothetical protein ACJX0J_011453, partial [Zea mays]
FLRIHFLQLNIFRYFIYGLSSILMMIWIRDLGDNTVRTAALEGLLGFGKSIFIKIIYLLSDNVLYCLNLDPSITVVSDSLFWEEFSNLSTIMQDVEFLLKLTAAQFALGFSDFFAYNLYVQDPSILKETSVLLTCMHRARR